MKHYILILYLFISISLNSQESYRALYNIKFIIDTTAIKKKVEMRSSKSQSKIQKKIMLRMKNQFMQTVKIANKIDFNLDFNKNESIFYLPPKIETEEYEVFRRFSRFKGRYYSSSDINLLSKNSFGQNFRVLLSKIDWTITNESRKLGNYKCYKAVMTKTILSSKGTSNHKVIAWFTPDIPFNFGPKGYAGLPGLIVRLDEGNISYILKSIKKNNQLAIKKPNKGEIIFLEDFNKIARKMNSNRRN